MVAICAPPVATCEATYRRDVGDVGGEGLNLDAGVLGVPQDNARGRQDGAAAIGLGGADQEVELDVVEEAALEGHAGGEAGAGKRAGDVRRDTVGAGQVDRVIADRQRRELAGVRPEAAGRGTSPTVPYGWAGVVWPKATPWLQG